MRRMTTLLVLVLLPSLSDADNPPRPVKVLAFRGPPPVRHLLFSPDGKQLTAYTAAEVIETYDAATGKLIHKIGVCGFRYRFPNESFRYSPGGKYLYGRSVVSHMLGPLGTIGMWDATTGKLAKRLGAMAVAFSPNDRYLLVIPNHLRFSQRPRPPATVIDRKSGKSVLSIPGGVSGHFSKDGKHVIVNRAATGKFNKVNKARGDWKRSTYDLATGKMIAETDAKAKRPRNLWNPTPATRSEWRKLVRADGRTYLVATWDKNNERTTIDVWDTGKKTKIKTLWETKNNIKIGAFSPDGSYFAASIQSGGITMVNLKNKQVLYRLKQEKSTGHRSRISATAFRPGRHQLASASHDRTIILWDLNKSEQLQRLYGHKNQIHDIAFRPDGKQLASIEWERVIIWNPDTGRIIRSFPIPIGGRRLAYSPDGTQIATANSPNLTAHLWDAGTGKLLHTLKLKNYVSALAFDATGRRLATCGGATVNLWDTKSGKRLHTVQGKKDVVAIGFLKDDRLWAFEKGGHVRMWNTKTMKALPAVFTFNAYPHEVVARPDGRRLAINTGVNTYEFSLAAKKMAATRPGHGCSYSADSQYLAVGSTEGTIRIWVSKRDE